MPRTARLGNRRATGTNKTTFRREDRAGHNPVRSSDRSSNPDFRSRLHPVRCTRDSHMPIRCFLRGQRARVFWAVAAQMHTIRSRDPGTNTKAPTDDARACAHSLMTVGSNRGEFYLKGGGVASSDPGPWVKTAVTTAEASFHGAFYGPWLHSIRTAAQGEPTADASACPK